ncbi:MAG TPA: hypothetical protein VII99_09645, partial [Bacteroidia bacterium]
MAGYDINLNHLTAGEYLSHRDSFPEYRKVVLAMLNINNDFIFEDDILKEHEDDSAIASSLKGEKLTMEKILESSPDRYFRHGSKKKKDKNAAEFTPVWFDIWKDYIITPKDFLFDNFFVYKLRQTDILEIDDLLNFFLEEQYSNQTEKFIRFLNLAVRKHGKKLLSPEHIDTIHEWTMNKEKSREIEHEKADDNTSGLSGREKAQKKKAKEKCARVRGDNKTKLTLEQTALLAYLLSNTRIILPLGKNYCEL